MTLAQYIADRKWLFHERGMDAELMVLAQIASISPTDDLESTYKVDPLETYAVNHLNAPDGGGDPPTLYRPIVT